MIYFIYIKEKIILENKTLLNKSKKNNIIITIIKKNKDTIKNDIENIICPECKNLVFLNINDDIIKLDNCINKHIMNIQ